MLLESFGQSILRFLRIPPGTAVRKANEVGTNSAVDLLNNDYVSTILDITVDDICIGETPLSYDCIEYTPEEVRLRLDGITAELNTCVKDIARDLCATGASVYTCEVSDKNRLLVFPYVDPVTFWMTSDKRIVAVDENDEPLEEALVFLNFDKWSLVKVDEQDRIHHGYRYQINPTPMQLKNITGAITSLSRAESNLDRYRAISSRIARWASVNVGNSQGDQQKDVVDTISSAINANSSGLTSFQTEYDDNIPVLPHRNGIGEVSITDNVPSYNLGELGDIDHYRSKLCLMARFPSTYMDFSSNLDSSVASTLRGDLRYSKLCNSVRSLIIKTLNDFIRSSQQFAKYEPCFVLTQIPTSEDSDVMDALDNYVNLADKVESFVIGQDPDEPSTLQLHRLRILQDLFASSTTSPALQKWFEDFREYIETAHDEQSTEEGSGEFGGNDFGGGDEFGGGPDDFGGDENFNESDFGGDENFDESDFGGDENPDFGGDENFDVTSVPTPPDDVEFTNIHA